MKKMKIAIVGVGRWGKNLLKEFDKLADVVWVCHKGSAESIKFLKENYPNIKVSVSLEDILDDSAVETVVVATPTETHFEIAQRVLGANKHLFLEKPGCSKSSELEQLCKEVGERKLAFAVGYEFAHHPALKKLRELVKPGDVKGLYFEWNKWGTFDTPIILNLLSHDISVIKSLGINSLEPKNYCQYKVVTDADIVELEFENDENIPIKIRINRSSVNKNKNVTVIGTSGSYIWNNDDLFEMDAKDQTVRQLPIGKDSAISEEIKDFLRSVGEKTEPPVGGKFALEIWKIIDEIKS